ncbi:MAG: geranylgeranylglyceryl/heptaprenylglyceryl phosphate synthase [Chlorobi bacterium]|nr:geranylgeranylglyceryl/heptaprenylglyceryl phosphate synthase [Chlorobiota bacterium]
MARRHIRISRDRHGLAVLVDPDKFDPEAAGRLALAVDRYRPSWLFVGGSFTTKEAVADTITALQTRFDLPVILFPGDYAQLVPHADAVLFLTLLSGRNPEYLAGQQVKAAPLIARWNIPVLPTAYLLVESGNLTTVRYVTQTLPIPRDKPELAVATALAARYMGMQYVYLEAGSGASLPVPLEMVEAVSRSSGLPVIVGGGIKPERIEDYYRAGAHVVVIGTHFETSGI